MSSTEVWGSRPSDRDEAGLRDVTPGALVVNVGLAGSGGDRPPRRFRAHNLYGITGAVTPIQPNLQDGGHVVVTSSILARIGVGGYTSCASKAGPASARRRARCGARAAARIVLRAYPGRA